MKIQGPAQVGSVNMKYVEVAKKNQASAISLIGNDKVEFSENAKIFSSALKAAKDVPDVRMERVEAIRRQIVEGTYNVDSRKIAEKMISHIALV